MATFRFFPSSACPKISPAVRSTLYQSAYSHTDELAQPGYYAVTLASGIRVELAAALRSGIATFTYPSDANPHTVLINLSRNLSKISDAHLTIQNRQVTGWVSSGYFSSSENHYRIYFAFEFDATPTSSGTFDEFGVKPGVTSATGPRSGAYLTFNSSVTALQLKVGLSYVSATNAASNLRQEIPGWNTQQVRANATTAWNAVLNHAQVTGGSNAQQTVFYTALYHAFLHPSTFSDVNGEYLGFDEKVHIAQGRTQYANYSGWDIYRSETPLIAMLLPDIASDIAQSLIGDAEQGGGLPRWPVANDEAGDMVGDPAAAIIAGIYAFGARHFDAKAALAAMLHGATDTSAHSRLYLERPRLADYLSKGYIAHTTEYDGAASVTLEDTNADFAISQFASALGDTKTAQQFLQRSANWRNLFDPETKYIRARGQDGKFLPAFTPASPAGFVEGNSAQYTWMIPYDLKGVIDAVGGPQVAKQRLDEYFSQYGTNAHLGPYFYIGNEPSFGDPWIYNWAGYPWRTQEVVRKTLGDLFSETPGGEPGNDDLGATSSWVVFGYLGFYPEIPAVGGVTTNSPVFPRVTLLLGNHPLQIIANGAPAKLYVNSIALDGKPIRNWFINWDQLAKAKELNFSLSATPNEDPGQMPPSYPAKIQPQE